MSNARKRNTYTHIHAHTYESRWQCALKQWLFCRYQAVFHCLFTQRISINRDYKLCFYNIQRSDINMKLDTFLSNEKLEREEYIHRQYVSFDLFFSHKEFWIWRAMRKSLSWHEVSHSTHLTLRLSIVVFHRFTWACIRIR